MRITCYWSGASLDSLLLTGMHVPVKPDYIRQRNCNISSTRGLNEQTINLSKTVVFPFTKDPILLHPLFDASRVPCIITKTSWVLSFGHRIYFEDTHTKNPYRVTTQLGDCVIYKGCYLIWRNDSFCMFCSKTGDSS